MLVVDVVVAGDVDVLGEVEADVEADVETVGEVELAVVVTVDDELPADGTLDVALDEVVTWSDEPGSDGTGAIVTGSFEVGAGELDCWAPLPGSDEVAGELCCAAADTSRWAAAVEQAANETAIATTPSTAVMPVRTERAVAPLP